MVDATSWGKRGEPAPRFGDLLVHQGTPSGRQVKIADDQWWQVRAVTYDGLDVSLVLRGVARSGGLLCVEQPRPDGDPWLVWVQMSSCQFLGNG